MTKSISIAEAKTHFSDIVNRVSSGQERFLIERRGRPVGAIISAEDLRRLENGAMAESEPGGLLAAVGALAEFDEFEAIMDEVVKQRQTAVDREVNLDEPSP